MTSTITGCAFGLALGLATLGGCTKKSSDASIEAAVVEAPDSGDPVSSVRQAAVGGPPIGLWSLGGADASAAPTSSDAVYALKGPHATVTITAPTASSADARVAFGMSPAFRACAQKATDGNPIASGKVTLSVAVDAKGNVGSTTASASSLPSAEIECMKKRASTSTFDEGAARTVSIDVVHTSDK